MRIVSGILKGMPLSCPQGLETRPTSSKVRSAVINMLKARWADSHVLDVFAGSGGNGLEALSWGAASVHFVEKAPLALKALKRNCDQAISRKSELRTLLKIYATDIRQSRQRLHGCKYDVIWLDPPYKNAVPLLSEVMPWLVTLHLNPTGVVIIETANEPDDLPFFEWGLELQDIRTYGKTKITFASVKPLPDLLEAKD